MTQCDTVGLIINPRAGQGFVANARAARTALEALRPKRIYTGPGELGAAALEGMPATMVSILPAPAQPGREQTQALAAQLAQLPLSMFVVIGGDGTLADVACVLIAQKSGIPLLGIGVGSTNAGNLITCRAAALGHLSCDRLQVEPVRALLAYDGNRLLGIGFNDCVLGFTVVGTLNGVVCDLDATAKLKGQNCPGEPRSIGTTRTLVQRVGPDGLHKVAGGRKVATLVIGFAEQSFFAKAITGGVCLAALVQAPAGCLAADIPLVQIGLDRQAVISLPPITSSYTTLAENQRIRVSGVRKGAAVCVDGNPLQILEPADVLEFGVVTDAVQSIRLV
jgi:hypothetical protein